MSEAHKFKRRTLEWAFPGRMAEMTEAWNGTEDYQRFLNRAAKWTGAPVSAAEIAAKETAYSAHLIASAPTPEKRIAAWLAENPFADALIRALNKPTTDPDHLPPNKALPPADLVAKIKANLK